MNTEAQVPTQREYLELPPCAVSTTTFLLQHDTEKQADNHVQNLEPSGRWHVIQIEGSTHLSISFRQAAPEDVLRKEEGTFCRERSGCESMVIYSDRSVFVA